MGKWGERDPISICIPKALSKIEIQIETQGTQSAQREHNADA
jgi:hypothetical protein